MIFADIPSMSNVRTAASTDEVPSSTDPCFACKLLAVDL